MKKMLPLPIKKRRKRIIVIICFSIILFLSIVLFNPIRTIISIRKTDGLYTMTYYGNNDWIMKALDNYYFNKYSKIDDHRANECSLFTAFGNPDHPIFGRNDDNKDVPVLVTKCNPSNGYTSIQVSRINVLGFKKDLSSSLPPLLKRILFLEAPYFTFDGMNEKGITLASANVSPETVKIDNSISKISWWYLNRKILDHSRNVDEAVSIIKKYNLVDADGVTLSGHFLIGDSSGKSIIVECNNGNIKILPNSESWQVATNTPVYYSYENDFMDGVSCWRYQTAYKELKEVNGNVDWKKGMKILEDISYEDGSVSTQWSTIYDMKNGNVYLSLYRKYNKIYKFNVKEKGFNYKVITNKD